MTNSILIVDDNPENLKVLSGILKKEGYKLRYATSGEQALTSIKESLPDLILLDIMMPDMDGYETCLKIKQMHEANDVPVVFLSALSETVSKVRAFEAGGVDFVEKPFHSVEVLARIKTHLALSKAKRKQEENAKRLADAEKVSNMGTYSWNVETNKMTYSNRLIEVFELEESHVTQDNIFDTCLKFIHEEDLQKVDLHLKNVRESSEPWVLEFRIITRLGNLKYIFASGSKGQLMGEKKNNWVTGIIQDVTKFKQNEEVIKLMVDLTDNFTEEESIERAYEYVLQRICRFMGWSIGHVFLYDNSDDQFSSADIWYLQDPGAYKNFKHNHAKVTFSESDLPGVITRSETFVGEGSFFDIEKKSKNDLRSLRLKGVYALPIKVNKKVVAILEFFAHQIMVNDDSVLNLLNEVGTRLGSILKQKLLYNEIRENEAIQERMITSASYPIVIVNRNSEIVKINKRFTELFDYEINEILGQRIDVIIPRRHHHNHGTHTSSYHKSPKIRNMGIGMELSALKKDGTEFPVEISLTPLSHSEGTVMASIYDISSRKKAEEELKESHDRLRLAVESGKLGVWDWDIKKGTFVWDDSMYFLYDIPKKNHDQPFVSFHKLLHPNIYLEDIEKVNKAMKAALGFDDVLDITFRVAKSNGKLMFVAAKGRVKFNGKGEPIRMIGVNIDLTGEIEIKQALEKSNKELESFAYIASHDLQEPLRVITSYLQIIEDKYTNGLEERGVYLMKRIVGASNRMKTLINDLLAYSRIDRRGSNFEKADLNVLINDVLTDSEVLINENKAEIEVGELCTVFCDPGQMRQVFMNLLNNGIKYQKPHELPRVKISCKIRDNNIAEIIFEDNGVGIKPEFFDRIFEIFQRLHTQEEYGGTGLGLAITKKIVERHQGSIKVESKYGEGSKFIVALPLTLVNEENNENN